MRRSVFALVGALLCRIVTEPACGIAAPPLEDAEFAYERGDYTQAARIFSPLAEQGVASAQFFLGLMHEKGRGVQQDHATAVTWFLKAAEQGYAGPQNNLGLVYERGRGVRQDIVRALMWYTLAVAMLTGNEQKLAMSRRTQLISQMTADQIKQAEEMARRCQHSQFKDCR